MATESNQDNVQNAADKVIEKAEARSEKIEGQIKEKIGKMDNDQQMVEDAQAKQAQAEQKG